MHLICFSGELCFGLSFSASKSWFLNLEPVHFDHVMAYRVFLKHTFLKSSKSFSTRKESNWEFGIGIYYLKWTIWKTNPTFGLNQLLDRWSFATCSQNQERVWKFTAWWKCEIYNTVWLALTAGDSVWDDLINNRVDWMEHLDGNPFEIISSF